MLPYTELLQVPPYALRSPEKEKQLTQHLLTLTQHHMASCALYKNMLQGTQFNKNHVEHLADIPFIPVRLFKDFELKSIPAEQTIKVMTSSGTTGQKVSKIFLDKETATHQQKTLLKIVSEYIGKERLPMLIIDSPAVIKNRNLFSARGAGILGFLMFATDKHYLLDEEMKIDQQGIQSFLEKHRGKPILVFGFTFMVWQYLKDLKMDLSQGILIHGGGWKKLKDEAITTSAFKQFLKNQVGIDKVHNYYGMVEQTGSIYMECEEGYLHSSIFSDVLMRKPSDFSVCKAGEKGIIQVLSALPKSYPGHSILTEDEGVLIGEDTCACGRLGKYFIVEGRVKNAELRGCSDTFEHR